MRIQLLLPPCLRHIRLSAALVRATTLELAILAGHLLLYPTGISQERRQGSPGPLSSAGPPSPPSPTVSTGATGPAGATEAVQLPADRSSGTPVVLLHGFVDNRSVFVLLRRSLTAHGRHHVESLNYSPLTCDIRAAADLLGRHIEEICARTGHPQIDIVGHSLGGLIARYYVQRLGGDTHVRTLVTLGTPHAGTRIAPLMSAHPIVRQMRPHSDVIEELREPAPNCLTRFVSFWSDLDQLMLPLETACIDHPDLIAQNVRVSGIGHLALPVHPAVAAGIRQALEAAEAPADTSGTVSVA
ncbi:alpha/beta fold hydrolase [Streptomyces sp. A3M-1-3]|uniref:esterase/lipase family protein n=1 Tax=Streptomyces sp. A3M-1-3 TaxID=2962044 RepID=UPI0020B867F0|nr:alpha/beta fold hydrolase [Streptomyces sp. A3M-1-3]MCP3818864.1 alpha/beta fold hydrolase [Streptomyces sp. A3M-1-3]